MAGERKPKPTYKEWMAKTRREGYMEAMLDIARNMEETGDSYAPVQWIFDNTRPGDEAHTIAESILNRVRG